jgi:hypothetical protein
MFKSNIRIGVIDSVLLALEQDLKHTLARRAKTLCTLGQSQSLTRATPFS